MTDRGRCRVRGRAGLIAALAALSAGGCAAQRERETAAVWTEATRGRDPVEVPSDPDVSPGTEAARRLTGWPRLEALLREAERRLTQDDELDFAELAAEWCRPEAIAQPLQTEHGTVRVCEPDPPVRASERAFTLELGGEGSIGFVADDLTDGQAGALWDAALERIAPLCAAGEGRGATGPWQEVTPRATTALVDVRRCWMAEGQALVVARVARGEAGDRWQVSVALLRGT